MPEKSTVDKVLDHVTKTGGKVISLFSALLAAFLILYSSYVIYDTLYIQNQAFSNSWDLLQYRPEIIDDGATPLSGADTLASINEDYRAWLTIYDTFIDYPVMQGENDLYYASHDIYKKSSLTGALYLASGNSPDFSDTYNLIYGHHMDNSALFGGLDKFIDTDYFNSHREGILVTSDKVFDLYTFAVIQTDAYESEVYNVGNRNLSEILNFINGNNIHYDSQAAADATQIIAFSTCEAAETNGRLVVFAKMIQRDIEPEPEPEPPTTPDEPETPTTPSDPETPTTPTNPDNPGGGGGGNTPVNPGGGGGNTPVNPGGGTPAGGGGGGATVNPGGGTPATPGAPTDNANAIAAADNADNIDNIIDNGPGTEDLEDGGTPLADFINGFTPTGGMHGDHCWALINLICLIFTAYILLPLTHIKAKVSRSKMMKKLNENEAEMMAAEGMEPEDDELLYKENQFKRRVIIGIIIEIILLIVAIIAFILTEDMRLPMVLIDKWTPLMLILLALTWVVDLILVRYRKKVPEEEEEEAAAEAPVNQ